MTVRAVVIGAGPAGLAAASCLRRHGVPHVVVERGHAPLSGLRRVDPNTTLLSPTRLSRLPRMREADGAPPYLRFDELIGMLERYRERHRIAVETDVEVERVAARRGGFDVHCRGGRVLACTHVINATGMIGHPLLPPSFEPAACAIAWQHSLDARAEDLASVGELLVIGGGTSAAEVMETWLACRRSGSRAYLSLRSPLRALPHRVLGVDLHYLAWLPEHLPADPVLRLADRIPGLGRRLRRDPVLGRELVRAVRRGDVECVPEVAQFSGRECELVDGRRLCPDRIVFATGFRYAAPHLEDLVDRDDAGVPRVRACQSRRASGLYVLGVRFARTFASPYLRGLGRDAAHVAARIARGGSG